MAVFFKAFALVDASQLTPSAPKVVDLPRATADELVLAACLDRPLE